MNDGSNSSLISIERVVTFVLGPIVIAGSGTLSAWLSTQVGVHISAPEITGAFASGGLAAGALVWKWLHGRQKAPILMPPGVTKVLNTVEGTVGNLGIPENVQESAVKNVFHLAEGEAEKIAELLAKHLQAPPAAVSTGVSDQDELSTPPPDGGGEPIAPSAASLQA